MDDIDTSKYYVIRKGEYDDMKAEIERLRVDNRRLHMKLMVAYSEEAKMYDMYDNPLSQEARRG